LVGHDSKHQNFVKIASKKNFFFIKYTTIIHSKWWLEGGGQHKTFIFEEKKLEPEDREKG
jgi:hypothetical protein